MGVGWTTIVAHQRRQQRRALSICSRQKSCRGRAQSRYGGAMDDYIARRPERRSATTTEPLWREVLGARLRRLRKLRNLTLTQLARHAGLSPQYLSEIERGRKEPSSEMIAAISGALGISLLDLTVQVTDELHRATRTFVDLARTATDSSVVLLEEVPDGELSYPTPNLTAVSSAAWELASNRPTEQLSLVA